MDRCPELLERKKRNRQALGGGDDPAVVARQPDVLAMASQKLDRSQVQGVQRPERDWPRLKRTGQNRGRHLKPAEPGKEKPNQFPVRSAEATCVHMGPDFVFRQTTRDRRGGPEAFRWKPVLR